MSKVKKISEMSQEELLAHSELQAKEIAEVSAKLSEAESQLEKANATIAELGEANATLDKVKGIKKPTVKVGKKSYYLRYNAVVKVGERVVKADATSIQKDEALCNVLIEQGILKEVK